MLKADDLDSGSYISNPYAGGFAMNQKNLTSTRNDEDLLDQFVYSLRAGYSSGTRNFVKLKFKKRGCVKSWIGLLVT
jgi:hypothetical protein